MKIKRALISVYDKTGIEELAAFLQQHEVELLSTGATFNYLKKFNFKVKEVSDLTNFPEIFSGRVKTLHPIIHGGILAQRDKHAKEATENAISFIDLVVVNLYPFVESIYSQKTAEQIIENIDIGGVALLRAAAKNYHDVCVLSNKEDYKHLVTITPSLEWRKQMATKAFILTATYDKQIANWYQGSMLPSRLNIVKDKLLDFRYGENPHQSAAFYGSKLPLQQIQGKALSYNNFLDIESAFNICSVFSAPTAVIIKHNNPCGVAVDEKIETAYEKAFNADKISSFGGIIALNKTINVETAQSIVKNFVEVVIAPSVDPQAQTLLESKKNLRLLIYSSDLQETLNQELSIRKCFNGFLVQTPDLYINEELKVVAGNLNNKLKEDLIFAWKICKYVKSNAIVIAKNLVTLGIGAGQTSRVDSVNIAIQKSNNCQGAVLASDGFFPFIDSIILAAKAGIIAIIQPGGSIHDNAIIEAANAHNITMIFTGARHFKH